MYIRDLYYVLLTIMFLANTNGRPVHKKWNEITEIRENLITYQMLKLLYKQKWNSISHSEGYCVCVCAYICVWIDLYIYIWTSYKDSTHRLSGGTVSFITQHLANVIGIGDIK